MSRAATPAPLTPTQTNALGIAGFVISLVGFVGTSGLLCPIGLVVSLVALGREPKGFAIAGVVIGAVGTCAGLAIALVFGAGILAALGLGVAIIALAEPEKIELTADMLSLSSAAAAYRSEHGALPAGLDDLELQPTLLNDPWGHPYEYRLVDDRRGFDLVSRGADGELDTDDDVALSGLGEAWMASSVRVEASGGPEGGTAKVRIGNRTIEVRGSDESGVLEIDLGNRVLQITGDDEGGKVEVLERDTAPPPPAPEPAQPPADG